jgi:hypothetical protein
MNINDSINQAHEDFLGKFLPPHHAVLFNEDRREFDLLHARLLASYRPVNFVAACIVRDIAVARWHQLRYEGIITNLWNLSIIHHGQAPATLKPEYFECETMNRAAEALHTGTRLLQQLNRQVDLITHRIERLERRLRFAKANFSTHVIEPEPDQPKEPQEPEAPKEPDQPTGPSEPEPNPAQPVFVTEDTPAVIAYYKSAFPGRRIVVLPPDDVARGAHIQDDLPPVPRRKAS